MNTKLLVLELWGVGDLTIASMFLRKASESFEVTLLAQSYAQDLQELQWPGVRVIPFHAPWTAFNGKYRLSSWPWGSLTRLLNRLQGEQFDIGVSARWDPRDHMLLHLSGAKRRVGYPRIGSRVFLTEKLELPSPDEHRYEYWRLLGERLGLDMPGILDLPHPARVPGEKVAIHTGAGQPVRVWPLERYKDIAHRLRAEGFEVRIICNPEQRDWWVAEGEQAVESPDSISKLIGLLKDGAIFIGNDSGPGHLAAFLGVPTFTIFGPQVPTWFVPLHPAAVYLPGKPCPYKPCSDYCRFPKPHCMLDITADELWNRLQPFIRKHIPAKDVRSTK